MTKRELAELQLRVEHLEGGSELFRLARVGAALEDTKTVKDNAGGACVVAYAEILKIANNLLTQDNRATSYPLFVVRDVRDDERTEYVTTCVTQEGADAYIAENAHNLANPHVYVASGWRNKEWKLLRAFLLSLTGKDFSSKEGY